MRQTTVFIAGATGYVGTRLAEALLGRGHAVRALVRAGSEGRVAKGCAVVRGNALDSTTFADSVGPADTFVHLVGTPHPAPWKERGFLAVDLVSLKESVAAARHAGVKHFVFVSVAHPAPVMKAYIRVRRECERILAESGLAATVLRPWYVLGPGHWWPLLLKPFYWLGERIPATREGSRRLGLVTRAEMVAALVAAVEDGPREWRVMEVPEIRHATWTSPAAGGAAVASPAGASGVHATARGLAPAGAGARVGRKSG